MAKPLRTAPPASAITHLLNPQAAIRATSRTLVSDGLTASMNAAHRTIPEAPTLRFAKREFILTPDVNATLDHLIDLFRRGTRTRLSASHILRVLLQTVGEALEVLPDELAHLPHLRLPSNAPGREPERAYFERTLAGALRRALVRRLRS